MNAVPKNISESAAEVPADFILQVAFGLEDPDVIAGRFGYDPYEWSVLQQQDWFVRAVENKRRELRDSGYTFRMKAALAAEEMLDDVFRLAKTDVVGFDGKMDAFKYFSKLADLEPKTNVPTQQQGAGFSIVINMPGSGDAPLAHVVEAVPSVPPLLGSPPEGAPLSTRINRDLVGDMT